MRGRHYSLCSTLHVDGNISGCVVGNPEVMPRCSGICTAPRRGTCAFSLTKFQDMRQDIAEFYSLCRNQISAFLGLIGVSA